MTRSVLGLLSLSILVSLLSLTLGCSTTASTEEGSALDRLVFAGTIEKK